MFSRLMLLRRAGATALLFALSAACSCGAASTEVATTSESTLVGMQNAKWGANVSVTFADGVMRYRSNGIPNHSRQTEYALPTAGAHVPSAATA
ncbi:MAG: hypothetical protein ABIT38_04880 [Gemmatimonadaceae bacterium]